MKLRTLAATFLPEAFSKLQLAGVIANPLDTKDARRLGERTSSDRYDEHILGRYHPGQAVPKPIYYRDDACACDYADMMTSWCASFSTSHSFGYYVVDDAKVWPTFGVYRTDAGHFLDVYCNDRALRNPKYEVSRRSLKLIPELKRFKSAIFISPAWYHNYYHWMIDLLPRLGLVTDALSEGVPVIAPKNIPPQFRWALRSALNSLNMQGTPLLELSNSIYGFERLVLPTNRTLPLDVSPEQMEFLRRLQPERNDLRKRRRIYVSRSDANIRRIHNEEEVSSLLATFGFETVTLSSIDVLTQSRLFSEAEAVVGHHGAGLTNLVFCDPGTFALEIFQQGHFSPSFARIAQNGELSYAFAVGEAKNGDTVVNSNHLRHILHSQGL